MPPKKVEPPPPPVEPEPEGPKEPDPETVEAATEVLNELINVSFAGARNRELDNKRVPYVVNRFMQQFETIVPLYFTSNDAGINGPDFDPAAATAATLKTAWDVEPEASQPPLDYWSRGAVPWRKRSDLKVVMPFQKPGALPPPVGMYGQQPITCTTASLSAAAGKPGPGRPQSAQSAQELARGRSFSAAGPLRPSSAAALRASGSLVPSASQPTMASGDTSASQSALGRGDTIIFDNPPLIKSPPPPKAATATAAGGGVFTATAAGGGARAAAPKTAPKMRPAPKLTSAASTGSLGSSSAKAVGSPGGAGSAAAAPAPPERSFVYRADDPGAEWTKSRQLLCRGPEHLQPKFRKAERSRRLALELEPDPEQRKINALRVVLQKERELAQAEIATLEKKFAKSDFFYSKGALESKASVSDFFYRELGEPVEKSKPNHAKMQPQPNFLSVSELEKGLLPGQKPEPPPAPAKKRQPPQPTTKKEDGPLEPEELAKLEAAAIKAAQEHLLKTVAAAREADGKASYTPLGSRQPPLRETMKAAKGVRLVPDHVLVAELLGNPRPPTTAPSPNRKPVSFETKTKSAPELVAASLSGS
jgi:hypothetical protein